MKKKARTKKSTRKQTRKTTKEVENRSGQLNLMIQINEPKALRKDLLEALREVIIFMQGYETFQKIQKEKMTTFAQLRGDVKVLNNLVDEKLRKLLPKGKLVGHVHKPQAKEVQPEPQMPASVPVAKTPVRKPQPQNQELDDLEYQLRDIEGRLKNLE